MRASLFLLTGFSLLMIAITLVANFGYGSDFLGAVSAVPLGLGDKLGHAVLFGTLALLANLATRHRFSILATAIVTFAATADELSQRFLTHRNFDLLDLVASLIGIAAAATIAAVIAQRSQSTAHRENDFDAKGTTRIAGK